MKKLTMFISAVLLLAGCDEYNDAALRERIDDLDARVETLEERIERLGGQVEALETLVAALDAGWQVASVDPTDEGIVVRFDNGRTVEIAPAEGAAAVGAAEEEGVWYWTLTADGHTSFLTDPAGERVPVLGNRVGIDAEGYWTLNSGEGSVRIRDEEGNPVRLADPEERESLFASVTDGEGEVVFVLSDGTVLTVGKVKQIAIDFPEGTRYVLRPNQTRAIPFAVTGRDARNLSATLLPGGLWRGSATLTPQQEGYTGEVLLTAPATEQTSDIVLLVADGKGGVWIAQLSASVDTSVDLSAEGTANCYVVSTPGSYYFDATKRGNGAAMPEALAAAAGFAPELEIPADASADWLWTSDEGLLSDIRLDNGRIRFKAGSGRGNAVIALSAGGEILWSWHIWLTDDPTLAAHTGSAAEYEIMDRNLGATSSATDDVHAYGLYYQWGRKDPFAGAAEAGTISTGIREEEAFTSATASCRFNPAFADAGWAVAANDDASISTGRTIAYTIAHPTTFVRYNLQIDDMSGIGTWYNEDYTAYLKLWGFDEDTKHNTKTLFDPCPPGWKVPGHSNTVWADLTKDTAPAAGELRGRSYHGGYYPAAGLRLANSGRLSNTACYAYFWSAANFNEYNYAHTYKAYQLYFNRATSVSNNYSGEEASGASVRCVREKAQ